ncbi:MAG: hypothetical protein Q8M03_09785 [Legionella sp.]|nr:hypothetical protein [Legionella sp.]
MLPIENILTLKDDPEQLTAAIAQFLIARQKEIQVLAEENATEKLQALKEQIQREISQLRVELAKTGAAVSNVNDVMQHYLL